ncbi:hypothetical protein [Streptomyces sp. NPDC047000]|uniref:hypothetical protein n=1 Tax=Streptomyces sp. NPDC047000 TaxID=3155474 RepID=UPI0033F6AB6C
MRIRHRRRGKAAGSLAAALAGLAVLVLPTAAPAHAASPCSSDNPPDWCFEEPGDGLNDPYGTLSPVTRSPGGIMVSGQAHDPDGGPVSVTFSMGGTTVGTLTTDSGGAYSGFLGVPTATGTVCAVANNIGAGTDAGIGCSALSVSHDPVGSLDTYTVSGSSVVVEGWALDPDTAGPVQVMVEYGGHDYGPYTADVSRPDVAAAYPGYGDRHGYRVTFTPPVLYGCNFAFGVRVLNTGAGTDSWPGFWICS